MAVNGQQPGEGSLETLSIGQDLFEAQNYLQVKSSTGSTFFYLDGRECR
jgi:hypothetical protein